MFLTTTPIRRDGRQPIIIHAVRPYPLCGGKAGRHAAIVKRDSENAARADGSAARHRHSGVFRHLAANTQRSEFIATTVAQAYQEDRKILVLTERTDHLESTFLQLSVW